MELLHASWIPAVRCHTDLFYAFGNTQMEDLLKNYTIAKDVDVLLLGVGDIRHILKAVGGFDERTKFCKPPQSIRFVATDIDASIIARDILLLTIVDEIDPTKPSEIAFLWDVWYNKTFSKEHHRRLNGILTKLVKEIDISAGHVWKYGNDATRLAVKEVLEIWSKTRLPEEQRNDQAGFVEMLLESPQLYVDSADFLLLSKEKHEGYFKEWSSYQQTKSARGHPASGVKLLVNPSISRPMDDQSRSNYDIEPWFSYFPMER